MTNIKIIMFGIGTKHTTGMFKEIADVRYNENMLIEGCILVDHLSSRFKEGDSGDLAYIIEKNSYFLMSINLLD